MRKFSFFFSLLRLIYILPSDTHCYRLRLLLLDAHCCRRYELCDCKLVDANILKEWLIQLITQLRTGFMSVKLIEIVG